MSDRPSRPGSEWLRQKVWPFPKRASEGADSVLPHVEEFLDQPMELGKRQTKQKTVSSDKPSH